MMVEIFKKPHRRWLRFSLRTFFILLTIFCVWLGVVSTSARRQREAVAWVEENHGWIDYDWFVAAEREVDSESCSARACLAAQCDRG